MTKNCYWGFTPDPPYNGFTAPLYGPNFMKIINVLYGLCLSKAWDMSDGSAEMISFLYFSETERRKKVSFTRLKNIKKS